MKAEPTEENKNELNKDKNLAFEDLLYPGLTKGHISFRAKILQTCMFTLGNMSLTADILEELAKEQNGYLKILCEFLDSVHANESEFLLIQILNETFFAVSHFINGCLNDE